MSLLQSDLFPSKVAPLLYGLHLGSYACLKVERPSIVPSWLLLGMCPREEFLLCCFIPSPFSLGECANYTQGRLEASPSSQYGARRGVNPVGGAIL